MENEQIHVLLEDRTVFESVCEFLGTDPLYYDEPHHLAKDFGLKEITLALDHVIGEAE